MLGMKHVRLPSRSSRSLSNWEILYLLGRLLCIPAFFADDILADGPNGEVCDDLLQLFHGSGRSDGIPDWEGAFVSQVCVAEGTAEFVNL